MNKIKKTFYVSHFWGFFLSINSTAFILTLLNFDILELYGGHSKSVDDNAYLNDMDNNESKQI